MATRRYLNVQYGELNERINLANVGDISDVKEKIKERYEINRGAAYVQLWKKTDTENVLVTTWSLLQSLPDSYFEEEGLFLKVEILPQPNSVPNLAAVRKRSFASDDEIVDQVKKGRFDNTELLVQTVGADFVFSDRDESMRILAKSISKRYVAWKSESTDRNLHPIAFLADGPGSGKSRFLQELPTSFVKFVGDENSFAQTFKDIFKMPVFINITFGNGSGYLANEAREIDIETSVGLRIQYQFLKEHDTFPNFYENRKNDAPKLVGILASLKAAEVSCFVLGIDEVNKVHERNPNFLQDLFNLVGSLSCTMNPFFVPIFAGTVIGPMESLLRKSTHPPLHIPLPLLSYESCLDIFKKKNEDRVSRLVISSNRLRQLISDCGGHCRTLEILYMTVLEFYKEDIISINWKGIGDQVRVHLGSRYTIGETPLGAAIAHSFLGMEVNENMIYPDAENLRYQDLEEKGLLKIFNSKVSIPYFFVCSFLYKPTMYGGVFKFWRDLVLGDNFWWQDWEVFNRDYIAFRLSLYAYLNIPTVSLKDFFAGAKMHIKEDITIKIPRIESLSVSNAANQYPNTARNVIIGECVKNASGAAFDAYLYLETTNGDERILLAFQMKYSASDAGQVITDNTVTQEYEKTEGAIDEGLDGTKFVFIMLGLCKGDFDEKKLPDNCVVISEEQVSAFYGPYYHYRLKNRNA